jgi:hypothetical protein
VLAGTVVATSAWRLEGNAFAGDAGRTNVSSDPALALWREWETAHKLTERLCRRQQRLETRLVESVGFPRATVHLPDDEDVTVHSIEALNEVLGKGPEMAALREKAEADFAAHQARWDAAAEETGYTAALRAERKAGERAQDLLEAFSTTPATTLAGVASKLMRCCARARPGRNAPSSPGRKSARRSAISYASPSRRCRNSSFMASGVPSSARGGLAAVSVPEDEEDGGEL